MAHNVGDRVSVIGTRKKGKKKVLTVTGVGVIIKIDQNHHEGIKRHRLPYFILFDGGYHAHPCAARELELITER